MDWYYFAAVLGLLLVVDLTVLQNLPDSIHTNLALLMFWHLVGVTLAAEVWLRRGATDGTDWATGYLLELVFSVDQVVVVNQIFWVLATPQRLLAKAMFITLLGNFAGRGLLILGAAPALEQLRVVPYVIGLWLVYCGTRRIVAREHEDVTQSHVVRFLRHTLGGRLGEYYDEEDEAVFGCQKGGRVCLTLLGVALLCSMITQFALSLDVALLKQEMMTDRFLDFSSAVVGAFSTRALFFVVRDMFSVLNLDKYGLGIVLLILGVETLLGRTLFVSALLSAVVVILVLAAAVTFSWLHVDPAPKSFY